MPGRFVVCPDGGEGRLLIFADVSDASFWAAAHASELGFLANVVPEHLDNLNYDHFRFYGQNSIIFDFSKEWFSPVYP